MTPAEHIDAVAKDRALMVWSLACAIQQCAGAIQNGLDKVREMSVGELIDVYAQNGLRFTFEKSFVNRVRDHEETVGEAAEEIRYILNRNLINVRRKDTE
jgi:hypothetical protein